MILLPRSVCSMIWRIAFFRLFALDIRASLGLKMAWNMENANNLKWIWNKICETYFSLWLCLLTDLVLVGAVMTPGTVSLSWLLASCSGEEEGFVCSWMIKFVLDWIKKMSQIQYMYRKEHLQSIPQPNSTLKGLFLITWDGVEACASSLRVTSKLSSFSFSTLHYQTEREIYNINKYIFIRGSSHWTTDIYILSTKLY